MRANISPVLRSPADRGTREQTAAELTMLRLSVETNILLLLLENILEYQNNFISELPQASWNITFCYVSDGVIPFFTV